MRQEKLHPHFFKGHSLFSNALYLTCFALGLPYPSDNQKYTNNPITKDNAGKILALFEERISTRRPVEYITQECHYLGNKFYVNDHVLIPRSLMNTRFQDFLDNIHWENHRVLDLCAGSGCIGITLALLNPNITVDLVDISANALEVARININHYGLQDRVRCLQSDLFDNVQDKYDLIITNPPYVSEREYEAQAAELKNEPIIALTAGKDGLDIIHKILAQSQHYLNPNGTLIAEVGYSVAKLLKQKYRKSPFEWFKARNPEGESLLDKVIEYFGLLDSVFLCRAQGIPAGIDRK